MCYSEFCFSHPSRLVCSSLSKSNLGKKKKVLSPTYKNPLKDCGSSLFSCFFSQCDTQMLDSRKTPPRICVNPQQSFTSFRTTAKRKMKLSGQSWITTANMCIDAEKLYHLKEKVEANESLNKQHLLQIFNQFFKATRESKCKRKQCKVFINTDLPRSL